MAGPLLRTSGHEDHRHPTPLQQAIQPPHQDHTTGPEPERTLTTPAGTRPDLAETALTYETVPLQVLPRKSVLCYVPRGIS